jgi:integrase
MIISLKLLTFVRFGYFWRFRGNIGSIISTPMPRKPSFSFAKTPYGWKVEIPGSLSSSGKRERAFFPTRDKARDFAQELEAKHRTSGSNAISIKPSVAEAALRADEILAPTGASVIDAANAYRQQWDAKNSSYNFSLAVEEYLISRGNLRPSTLSSYKYTLQKVFQPMHPRTLSEVTTEDLSVQISGKGGTACRMHLANLRAFWRWAAKAPRRWCREEIIEGLEAPRRNNDDDISILSPEDVRALLSAAEAESHAAAATYAIAVFGGVRMGELEKLSWKDVKEDFIEIGADIAKKHSRRLVPLDATLSIWLATHRDGGIGDTPIVPANWAEVSKAVRRRAGWGVVARTLKNPPTPTRGKWPNNACRHTCASVQVAIGTPLEALTFKFGHSGGHDLLRKHYVSRLSKKDAIAILTIGPSGKEVCKIHVA